MQKQIKATPLIFIAGVIGSGLYVLMALIMLLITVLSGVFTQDILSSAGVLIVVGVPAGAILGWITGVILTLKAHSERRAMQVALVCGALDIAFLFFWFVALFMGDDVGRYFHSQDDRQRYTIIIATSLIWAVGLIIWGMLFRKDERNTLCR